jgi:hypothetical protein
VAQPVQARTVSPIVEQIISELKTREQTAPKTGQLDLPGI